MQPMSSPGIAANAGAPSAAVPSAGAQDPAAIAAAAVKGISHIATLPEITLSIIEIVEKPTSSAQDLNKIISNDPALCSRVLKVVNSAFYGLPRQIGSINRAISLLGLNAVKNLAIAASLAKLFKGGALAAHFEAKDLWSHSVATAATSKLIASHLKLNFADEAFLAGLIHDIGIMVELQADREKLASVVQRIEFGDDGVPIGDFVALERSTFGCDHGVFGAALCEAWKFPKSFTHVCGHHHDPTGLPPEHRTLAWIAHVSDRLAAGALLKGFRMDLPSLVISDEALAGIRMTREGLAVVESMLPIALDGAEATLSVA